MKKYMINLNMTSIIAIIVFVYGVIITTNNIVVRNYLENVQDTYDPKTIKKNMFIETKLSAKDFLGQTSQTMTGRQRFFPLVMENAVTGEMRYIIKINESENYYITLIVTSEFLSEIEQLLQSTNESYDFTGQIVGLSSVLPYEQIASFLGSANNDEIDKKVSPAFAIKVVDKETQKKELDKNNGLFMIVIAVFIFVCSSIEKKE